MSALLHDPSRTVPGHEPGPLLGAAGPAQWFATHLRPTLDSGQSAEPELWIGIDDLLAGGAALMVDAHRKVLEGEGRGGTAQMAAKWVLAWMVGPVAAAVGLSLAAGSAGVLIDSGRLRLRLHPDGWVDRVEPAGCLVAVTSEHPWAGQDGVVVVADETELVQATLESLVEALRPVVDAARGLARVGARTLWAEIADELGLATTYRPDLPGRADVVARLQTAVTAPGAPWRVAPSVRTTTAPWGAQVYVGQKGGCCLAYQRPTTPEPDEDLTDDLREYHARFARALPDGRQVCTTCSLRDETGCDERQLFWLERRR